MTWLEVYKEMKDNKSFVKRKSWDKNIFIWLKPEFEIQASFCKDENLKKLVQSIGKFNSKGIQTIKGESILSICTGNSVISGFVPSVDDVNATDWEIVNL